MPTVRKNKSTIQAEDDLVVIGDDNRIMGNAARLVVRGNDNVVYADNATIEGDENTINGNNCDVMGNDNIIMGTRGKVSGRGNLDMSLPSPPSPPPPYETIGSLHAGDYGGAAAAAAAAAAGGAATATARRYRGPGSGGRAGKYRSSHPPNETRTTGVWVNGTQVYGAPDRATRIANALSEMMMTELLGAGRATMIVGGGGGFASAEPTTTREGTGEAFPRLEGEDTECADFDKACVVCKGSKPCVLFMPCNHLHTCKECSRKMSESVKFDCPVCRKVVTGWRPVFQ